MATHSGTSMGCSRSRTGDMPGPVFEPDMNNNTKFISFFKISTFIKVKGVGKHKVRVISPESRDQSLEYQSSKVQHWHIYEYLMVLIKNQWIFVDTKWISTGHMIIIQDFLKK